MKQKILTAGLVLLAILILGCVKPPEIKQNISLELENKTAETSISLNGTDVEELFQKNNISADGLKLIRFDTETLNGNNYAHARVQEYVNGIPVSEVIIYHFKNGIYYLLSGHRAVLSDNETQPKVSRQAAFDTACRLSKSHADGSVPGCDQFCCYYPRRDIDCGRFDIEEIYWTTGADDYALAWEIKYNDTKTPDIIIDALTGKVLYDAPWAVC